MDVVIKMSRHLVNVFRASTCAICVLSLIIRMMVFDEVIYDRAREHRKTSLMEDLVYFSLEWNNPFVS